MDATKLQGNVPDAVYNYLNNNVIADYSINSNLQLAHFMAQCDYESGSFQYVEEKLGYSAQGLLKTFPKYFDAITAGQYAGKPIDIANHVYANRFGNGDEASGDGWLFRGRGYIQITFKNNYEAYGQYKGIDFVTNPDFVASKYPLDSAAHFFSINGLFSKSDDGDTITIVEYITQRVSGTIVTANARYTLFLKYYNILNS